MGRGRLVPFVAVAAASFSSLSACTSHRAEAEAVVRNVEAVIKADGSRKATPLARLTETPCADAEVCRVKQICEEAFGPLVASYRLQDEVRAAMAQSKQDGAAGTAGGGELDRAALVKKLDEAEAAKEKARGAEEKCLIAKAELARKHRL
jgi:hypothetical protein